MKCEEPKQPANDQNSRDNSQHNFFSLPTRARLSLLRSHARRPLLGIAESLADPTCAFQRETSVHLGTPLVHFADMSSNVAARANTAWNEGRLPNG